MFGLGGCYPQGPLSPLEDLSLSTRINQGSGGGKTAGDSGLLPMFGITMRKWNSLSCRLNDDSDGAERTASGRLFHVRGPATGNEWSLTVTNRDCGTRSISVSVDDLSQCLDSTSATRWNVEDRYGGARSCGQRYTSLATLKLTRSTALSQCSSIKVDVMWSDRRRL